MPQQAQDALFTHARQCRFNAIRVDQVGLLSLQAEDDGLVCPVTSPGGPERAEEFAPDTPRGFQQAALAQCKREHAGCTHRPDRMGA